MQRRSKSEIFEHAAPATLLIVVAGRDGPETLGSGVVITADGLAATCYHVISDALDNPQRLWCFLPPAGAGTSSNDVAAFLQKHRGELIPCRLGALAPEWDLALLHLEQRRGPFPFVELPQNVRVRPGEDVITIGNPHGLVWTLTAGSVSAVRDAAIQMDAPISPGNSGGPLLNMAGELIGINSFKHAHGQNLGFAQSAERVRRLIERSDEQPGNWAAVRTGARPRKVHTLEVTSSATSRSQRYRVRVGFDPDTTGGTAVVEGARLAVGIDGTFRNYHAWWRTGRLATALHELVTQAKRLGLPGVELWLHSLRTTSHQLLGAATEPDRVASLLPHFDGVGSARARLGDDRRVTPLLRELGSRVQPGRDNLLVGLLLAGPAQDAADAAHWAEQHLGRLTPAHEPYALNVLWQQVDQPDVEGANLFRGSGERLPVPGSACVPEPATLEEAIASVAERALRSVVCVGAGARIEVHGAGPGMKLTERTLGRRALDGPLELDVVPVVLDLEVEVPRGAHQTELVVRFEDLYGKREDVRLLW